ncbi:RNA-directed DNA polymerase, eukaryota, reverse transcriptase zinc-binding domain protein [Tanacetum coccineum]
MNMEMSEFRDVVNTLEIEDLCSSGFNFTWTKSLKNPLTTTLKKLDRIMINKEVIQSYKKAHGIFLPYLISDHSPSVLNLKQSLYDIQRQLDGDSFNKDLKECSVHIGREYTEATEDELKLLHQKAKINWLKEGNKNSAFFHSILITRKHKSRVESICKEDGSRFEEDALEMIRMVTNEEIKAALFDIDLYKAACPDGYNSYFLRKLGAALVKKHIAYCNVLYKCMSKIVTNRIKDGLSYNRKNGAKRCAMKIDIQKAYDTRYVDFSREGGLRQGNPISPYQFTIVVEVFNMIMIKNIAATPSFRYHYGCKELKLTHMCFADDLMVLCNGDKASLEVVKKAIEESSCVPGLFPNLSKSIIFFGSINEDRKKELLEVLPFKHGKLPMKYLGVPLISKKLSLSDCIIQLVASVLSAMHQYWASVYMLPVGVIKELDKIFKRFLWNSGNSAQGKARVSWKIMCRPKNQGGLDIVKLKGGSFWEVESGCNDSWGWKQLLVIRDKIKPFIIYKIGDEKGVYMWYDNWSKIVPLANSIPKKARNDARMKDNDIVADLVHNGAWLWPSESVSVYLVLSQIDVSVFNQNKDIVWWIDDCNKKVKYYVNTAWLSLRDKRPNVNWRHVVWFS